MSEDLDDAPFDDADANAKQLSPVPTNDDEDDAHQQSDLEHEKEDNQELEAARKERMDLMAAELRKEEREMQEKAAAKGGGGVGEGGGGGELAAVDKFQFLIGQSEVFAHFLAGELVLLLFVSSCSLESITQWLNCFISYVIYFTVLCHSHSK